MRTNTNHEILPRHLQAPTVNKSFGHSAYYFIITLMMGLYSVSSLQGQTSTWVNPAGGFYHSASNWSGGVPGPTGTASMAAQGNYTVNLSLAATNQNVLFNSSNANVTLNLGSFVWTVSNTVKIASLSPIATNFVNLTSGTLAVTNITGQGLLSIGDTGYGVMNVMGGTLLVDRLYSTNNFGGMNKSKLNLNFGVLEIKSGSLIKHYEGTNFGIGNTPGQIMVLKMWNGTNTIDAGVPVIIGSTVGARGDVTVSGPGTYWNTIADLHVGGNGSMSNQLKISAGATAYNNFMRYVGSSGSVANVAIVDNPGSHWSGGGNMYVGYSNGNGNLLAVSNGGKVSGGQLSVGELNSANNRVVLQGSNSLYDAGGQEVRVGTSNSTGNAIQVGGGAQLKSGWTYVGRYGSTSNSVTVSGNNTIWTNQGDLNVGLIGASANSVIVDNSARVNVGGWTHLGRDVGSASNQIMISGSGTVWSNSANFYVGRDYARDNRLIISNGAVLAGANMALYVGNLGATNNQALVVGTGSLLDASTMSSMYVGFQSSVGNQLLISNGAVVKGGGIQVGYDYSDNNKAVVSGSGSLLTNGSGYIYVGQGNSKGNTLTIDNGAQLYGGLFYVGFNTSSSNQALIAGTGSLVKTPGDISVGESYSSQNSLRIMDGAVVSGFAVKIGYNNSHSNEVWVSGAGSFWSNSAGLILGDGMSRGNKLFISNGAKLATWGGNIGVGTSNFNNEAWLVGAGSVWTNAGINVGSGSTGNKLVVSNGARMLNIWGSLDAANNYATNNTVILSGPGTYVSNAQSFQMANGNSLSNNLVIENGVEVYNNSEFSFAVSQSTNNEMLINGSATVVSNGGNFRFAEGNSSNNRMYVSNGASIMANQALLANNNSHNNQIIIQGSNAALLTVNGIDFAGNSSSNSWVIADGVRLTGQFARMGFNNATNNSVLITGSGTRWSNQVFQLGVASSVGNQMTMSNGATVDVLNDVYVGDSYSHSNRMILTGSGTRLSMSNNMSWMLIGNNLAHHNTLVASNGAEIKSYNARVGNGSTSTLAQVSGAGTVWTNYRDFKLGDSGSANKLTVDSGGRLVSDELYAAQGTASSNNTVTVSGAGSRLTLVTNLYVGANGATSNKMVIDNGGVVSDVKGYLGRWNGYTNHALVSGTGSLWDNASELYVGFEGSVGNRLSVSNGGAFQAPVLYISRDSGSYSNFVDFNVGGYGIVTNTGRTGAAYVSDLGGGKAVMNFLGGTLIVDQLIATNNMLGSWTNSVVNLGYGTLETWANSRIDLVNTPGLGTVTGQTMQVNVKGGTNTFHLLDKSQYVIGATNGVTAGVTVSGSGSVWSVTSALTSNAALVLGSSGSASGNLVLSNGGRANFSNVTVGGAFSTNNELKITGNGSVLSNQTLIIGTTGTSTSNRLSVLGGATLVTEQTEVRSGGNAINVSGSGTLWTNTGTILFGVQGANNLFTISSNAVVGVGGNLVMGVNSGAVSNILQMTGGSLYITNTTVGGQLVLGGSGVGILNMYGGNVVVGSLVMTNGANNIFNIYGGNFTSLSNMTYSSSNQNFVVGGTNNASGVLNISSGQHTYNLGSGTTLVGEVVGSTGAINVLGNGTVWSNAGDFVVGNQGQGNLLVSNGATVVNDTGILGGQNAGKGTVLVMGSNSLWNNMADLYVGKIGSDNELTVGQGGRVTSQKGVIGDNASSSNNTVTITGSGSEWDNSGNLVVGNNGGHNKLIINNGGTVRDDLTIGENSSFNTVSNISGYQYVTNGAGLLTVGNNGSFNNYILASGAVLVSSNTVVGNGGSANANSIQISGASTRWTNFGTVNIGPSGGSDNTVTLNSGTVVMGHLVVTNNASTLTFNGGSLYVGQANINNGQSFVVGNGMPTSSAYFRQTQTGVTNTFANGVTVNQNGKFSFAGVVTNNITLNGGTLAGTGKLTTDLTVDNGDRIAPGNSPGTMNGANQTWGGGGGYDWEINNFLGGQGMDPGWDYLNLSGSLTISATSGNEFMIDIVSLDSFNVAGNADNFNPFQNYSFTIATASGGIFGFNASDFTLNLSGFQNPMMGGTWGIAQSGNSIVLNYTGTISAVPEPGTYALMALGMGLVGVIGYRRRKSVS